MARQPKEATNPNAVLFQELLKMKRKGMGEGNRKKSKGIRKGTRILYPLNVERQYFAQIRKLLKKIIDPNTQFIRENIDNWINDYKQLTADSSTIKRDAYPDDLRIHIEDLEDVLAEIYRENGQQVRTLITDIGFDVSEFNTSQWAKFTKTLIGVEIIPTEPWEIKVIESWMEENFSLIKSLNQEYIKKVNTIVSEAVTQGQTSQSVMQQIRKLNKNISVNRAKLIARDQVGKLQGQLTQKRMTEAGIDKYIWITAGDERVRGNPSGPYKSAIPSHYVMPGLHTTNVYRWDDATVYSTDGGKTWKPRTGKMEKKHPGQANSCRCSSLPYVDDIIEAVDKQIKKEKRRAA